MSAHHYFKDFFYCDSGMIPWLLVAGIMSAKGKTLAQLVGERMQAFPASGEINCTIEEPAVLIAFIQKRYQDSATTVDHTDGLSMEFDKWRFNIRMSNTEPVVRLNVESKADMALMNEKTQELLAIINGKNPN
jgi:phosphomannomutase